PFDDEPRLLGGFRFRRRLKRGRAITHHIGADGGMRNLQADIERERRGFNRIHIFGEALPVPLDAFGKRGTRNVLNAFHEAKQPLALFRLAGRKADAAIAHDGRGDTVECRGLEIGVPGNLAVIMRMHIDEAGRHDLTLRIDLLAARGRNLADSGDGAPVNGNIRLDGFAAGAVINGAAPDYDVMLAHGYFLPIALMAFA